MSNTDRDSMLERWADGMEKLEQYYEGIYGPPATPATLPPITTYNAMLEAIADGMERAKRNINKKSPTYHSDSVAYVKTVPSGNVHYASLEQIGGKTLVWNQLIKTLATDTYTTNDIIFTVNADKSITISGTASDTATYFPAISVYDYFPIVAGHKYYHYAPANIVWGDRNGRIGGGNTIVTPSNGGTTNQLFFRVLSGTTVNVTFYPMVHDLTLMYGAGNEPTSVAEFQQQFPAPYYAFNNGSLLSAGVTEIKSVGINLFDPTAITDNAYLSTTTGLPEPKNRYFITDYIPVYAGQTVYIPNTLTLRRWFYDSNKTPTTYLADSGVQYYTPTQGGFIRVSVDKTQADVSTLIIAYVTSNTPPTYVPYNGHTYPIPAEVQALEGYGWSAGSVYNYVNFERKVFVQNVAKLTLAIADMDNDENYPGWKNSGIKNIVGANKAGIMINSVCKLKNGSAFTYNTNYNGDVLFLSISSYGLTQSEWKAQYPDLVLDFYIERPTPIETDISTYLTDDNLIEVEAGGTLTFENSNGDDYRIDVPSSETFMIDLQSAL